MVVYCSRISQYEPPKEPDMSLALLPTRTYINPMQPESATYFDSGQVAYIMRKTGEPSVMVATSFGDLGTAFAVGSVHEVHHDQTCRSRGRLMIIGVRNFATGESTGTVYDRKLTHHVFK